MVDVDTSERLATTLEWLAAQVREHGVLPGWEINVNAEGVDVSVNGLANRRPTGLSTHEVKFDLDRSAVWGERETSRSAPSGEAG